MRTLLVCSMLFIAMCGCSDSTERDDRDIVIEYMEDDPDGILEEYLMAADIYQTGSVSDAKEAAVRMVEILHKKLGEERLTEFHNVFRSGLPYSYARVSIIYEYLGDKSRAEEYLATGVHHYYEAANYYGVYASDRFDAKLSEEEVKGKLIAGIIAIDEDVEWMKDLNLDSLEFYDPHRWGM